MGPNILAYALGAALAASLLFGGVQCSQKQAARLDASKAQTAEQAAIAKLAKYEAEAAEAVAKFEVEARATEQRHSADMARIDLETRERIKNAQTAADRLLADLRAGNTRLQDRWQGCVASSGVSGTPGATGPANGATDDRSASASRIVLAASQCDAQVSGLQDVIRADRSKP